MKPTWPDIRFIIHGVWLNDVCKNENKDAPLEGGLEKGASSRQISSPEAILPLNLGKMIPKICPHFRRRQPSGRLCRERSGVPSCPELGSLPGVQLYSRRGSGR